MRWRIPLALATLAATTLTASAQNSPNHPQHWTVLMPTVSSATNCIAQMVLANAAAKSLARSGHWTAAIRAIGDVCDPLLRRMQATHDQLYGQGTGHQFLVGPYASDVPRAVAVRVQPQLDRSMEPRAQSPAQTPTLTSPSEEAQKLLSAAASEHWQCIKQAMIELVPFTNESAETLATAVLTKCSSYELKRVMLAAAVFRVAREEVQSVFVAITAEMRKLIITEIVTFRVKANRTAAGA